ncbi:sulfatase-like hydrolase/transferase [Nocardia sp. CDC153]|uniref:sulfatase-like hydrolase/transferase n=1 Tax=Nocardia sp. CDC153 TaxID=3112167 RepID=UPI002DBC8850|nr:sulfatase-like hydrolase/transferase [Nocardia sp. CDC153]MEC3956897.1 sulfatase-like hydrolase/transferase [Nocardia sp. CDC153]
MFGRRGFLTGAAASVGAAVAATTAGPAARARADVDPSRPNILVVIVDEMRAPVWFPDQPTLDRLLSNLARIRHGSVSFEQHYTAANDCTASRGALVTGLYSHQTGCMVVSESTLSPRFPTWGSMLREHGYETTWWGKWHLGHYPDRTPGALEAYGFAGGTYPSPNGAPGQGLQSDPKIVDDFVDWFDHDSGGSPWCTTVSLVNPHDIQYWPRWTRRDQANLDIPQWVDQLPGNFESLEQLSAKPRLQMALVQASVIAFGLAPYGTPEAMRAWIDMRNLYLWLQQQVDIQIGRVLDTLDSRPDVAANTVIVFTSDHGDYAGSHGLHGKGGGAYDEAVRVPLYVHDPRGYLSPTDSLSTRTQLTSSVDLAPLLLTIATGGADWRAEDRYEHLRSRLDLAALCRNGSAAGRPFIAHTTDESTIEEAAILFDHNAPGHVAMVRTADAKFASYSKWVDGRIQIDADAEQEFELYDYSTDNGRLELDNQAGAGNPLRASMEQLLARALDTEIQQPLPAYLKDAQEQGFDDYLQSSRSIASRAERLGGFLEDFLTPR